MRRFISAANCEARSPSAELMRTRAGGGRRRAGPARREPAIDGRVAATARNPGLDACTTSGSRSRIIWSAAPSKSKLRQISGYQGRKRKPPSVVTANVPKESGASGTSSGVMYVIVPPDTGPGEQMLVLTPAGQQCLVQIPEGAAPGTQFAVQLP